MTGLQSILQDSLRKDTSIVVFVEGNVLETKMAIHDSRTMTLYGIGRQDSPGFTLKISVNKNSRKGKEINSKLSDHDLLLGFIVTEGKRSITYLKDFGTAAEEIQSRLNLILDRLEKYRSSEQLDFIVRGQGETHELK